MVRFHEGPPNLLCDIWIRRDKRLKRPNKFYSRNEKITLRSLGLEPVPISGAGWIEKEDGTNDKVMVQLKSTDSNSYRIEMLDMKKLEYHAQTSHKVPIFLVQFLQQDKIYAIIDVNNINELFGAFETSEAKINKNIDIVETEVIERKVKSSKKDREKFNKERSEKYGRK